MLNPETGEISELEADVKYPMPESVLPEAVVSIAASTTFQDKEYSVIKNADQTLYLTVFENGVYLPFFELDDVLNAAESSIKLNAFKNLLGKDGIQLYYIVGANAVSNCFFDTGSDKPELFLRCGRSVFLSANYVISQEGGMGEVAMLYKTENGIVTSVNLNKKNRR